MIFVSKQIGLFFQPQSNKCFRNSMKVFQWSEGTRQISQTLPIIQIPMVYKRKIMRKEQRKRGKLQRNSLQLARPGKLLISCDKKQDSMLVSQFPSKFNPPTITSSTWTSIRSPGRHFTIHPVRENPSTHPEKIIPFEELSLSQEIVSALRLFQMTNCTAIQSKAIPEILQGKNVMFAAETGSGKTLAYLLPILHKILPEVRPIGSDNTSSVVSPKALILTPTQELSKQVTRMGGSLNLPVNFETLSSASSMKNLTTGGAVDVLVATPVPLLVALKRRKLDLNLVEFAVLDECDTLLDDSFSGCVQSILQRFNISNGRRMPLLDAKPAQLILSSATYPKYAQSVLEDIIAGSDITSVRTGYLHRVATHVKHVFRRVRPSEKLGELLSLIENFQDRQTIIFCNFQKTAKWLHKSCQENSIPALLVDGSLKAKTRSTSLEMFLGGKQNILITTDLLSRGLDTQLVTHVINFDMPINVTDYIHRCGRVGRVGQGHNGTVISLVAKKWEIPVVMQIEEAARRREEIGNLSANIKRKHEVRWQNKTENKLSF